MKPNRADVMKGILFAALMLATMEVASRLEDFSRYGAPLLGNYDFEKLFTFDGKVVRGVPNARYAKWALNSIGMRGPDPRPLTGQTRILVYGASEVFGIYESRDHEFPHQLENELNTRAGSKKFEVMNAGIPGMRVGSGLDYLKEIAPIALPSVVIIYPTPTHYIGVTRPNCGRPYRAPAKSGSIEWPASRLLPKFVDMAKGIMPKVALTLARKGMIAREMRGKETMLAVDPASLSAMELDMRCAVNAVHAIGARPVLVTHANRFGRTPVPDQAYWLTGWRAQYAELDEGGFIDLERLANERIRRVAATENVQLVDAGPALSGNGENFADHAHFTDTGSARMAKLLAASLMESQTPVIPAD